MSETPLTYETHRRIDPLYHYALVPLTVLNAVVAIWGFVEDIITTGQVTIRGAMVAVAALLLAEVAVYLRMYPLRVQDRLIRLEQRIRFAEILPEELEHKVRHLTMHQMIALRFAPDDEVIDLVKLCIEHPETTQDEIKKRIKHWVPDHARI